MKIVVLQGSPNRNGSTSILVQAFQKGAEEAGHTVEVIEVAYAGVHPCTGCVACGYEGPCVQKDGMERIRKELLSADIYDCFCHSALLLWDDGTAENRH